MYQKSLSYAMLFLRYMVRDRCNCYFSFWAISCPFTSLTAQKIKISKKQQQRNKKDTWRYHFTHLYQKLWLDDVRFLRYGAWQTDGQKKWHIEVGALPKKKSIFRTECNSLWDEKKKNCKPSSLIHTLITGQIYTIPKFIKGKIEKTVAQLSIWKCRLGILDTDTQ